MPAAVLWLIVCTALAAAETLTGELFLLMLSGGALATAGLAAVADFPLWADGVVFALVSVSLVLGVRPALLRRMHSAPALSTGTAALEGKPAVVLERVTECGGQIKLAGDVWSARSLDPAQVFEPGDAVTVMEIDGATAVVWQSI